MNHKLLREDYYNEDYTLNSQEQQEFLMPTKDPYWLVRSRACLLNLPIFGEKSHLQQNIEIQLFESKPNIDGILISPAEMLPNNSQVKNFVTIDLFHKEGGEIEKSSFDDTFFESLPGYKKVVSHITNLIPELKLMRKLSYPEIYACISRLADPHMVFINMFKADPGNNLVTGIIYFPFTPHLVNSINLNPNFILEFSKYLKLTSTSSNEQIKYKVFVQKLMDLYYLAEDSEELHGITDCYNQFSLCENIASSYCENHMCKNCCKKSACKEFCVIHDDLVNFFRKKTQDLLEFEHRKNYDRSLTIRVSIRQRTTKEELKVIFKDYYVNWEAVDFFFRKGVEKIQFVYLQCFNNDEASRLYEHRSVIIKEWQKLDLNIHCLMEPLEDLVASAAADNGNVENSGLLVAPISYVVNSKSIPKKENRNEAFKKLIEGSLNITDLDYKLSNCNNLVNKQFTYDYYIIQFANRELLEAFYSMQPFFESVIFHKFSHLKLFPMIHRLADKSLCMMCNNFKNEKCLFELCEKCCVVQSRDHPFIKGSGMQCNDCNKDHDDIRLHNPTLCPICKADLKVEMCSNKLCVSCCQRQTLPPQVCPHHQRLSMHQNLVNQFLIANDFKGFIHYYQRKLSIFKLKLIECLKNGDFSWFRPVADTNVTRLMADMNRELEIVMDNSNFKRENPLRINDKMYKLFTFQLEILTKKRYDIFNTIEGFDRNGDFFVEYDFTKDNEIADSETFVVASAERLETLDTKNVEAEITELENRAEESFHLIFYGLETEKFSSTDLIEEIYQELKNNMIKVTKDGIFVLDEQSLINFAVTSDSNFQDFNKLLECGRLAMIRLKNEKEALKIYTEKTRINLPLINGRKGQPLIWAGDLLKTYLDNYK